MDVVRGPYGDEPTHAAGWVLIIADDAGNFWPATTRKLRFWERSLGKYRFYQVFTARHSVALDYELQSAQSTYKFKAKVTVTAMVHDPVAALLHGPKNTAERLRQAIGEALQNAVRGVDFQRTDVAWHVGSAAVQQLDSGNIQLSEITLDLQPDAAAKEALRVIESEKLAAQASAAASNAKAGERAELRESMKSLDEMRILMMTTSDPTLKAGLKEAIARREQEEADQANIQVELFKILVSTGKIEDWEVQDRLRNLLEQIKPTHGGASQTTPLLDDASNDPKRSESSKSEGEASEG